MNAYAAGAPDAASEKVIPPEDSVIATTAGLVPTFNISVGYPSGASMGITLEVDRGTELARKMIVIQSDGSYDVIY